MAFRITSAAAREVLGAAERSGAEGMALRVAATPTPQGIRLGMGFDGEAPGDTIVEVEGLTVLVAPQSQPWLDHMLLDYAEVEDGARDFVLTEAGDEAGPSATEPTGCGSGGCSHCG